MTEFTFTFEYVPFDMDDMPETGDCTVHVTYEEGDDNDMIHEGFWFHFTVGEVDCTMLLSDVDRKYISDRIRLEHKQNNRILKAYYGD